MYIFSLIIQFLLLPYSSKDRIHDSYYEYYSYYIGRKYRPESTGENPAQMPLSLVVVNPIPIDNAIANNGDISLV